MALDEDGRLLKRRMVALAEPPVAPVEPDEKARIRGASDSYIILTKRLGAGTYGTVYKGKRVSNGADVAIKFYDGSALHSREEAHHEALKLAYLNYVKMVSGVVKVLDDPIPGPNNSWYVVLELINGLTLHQYIYMAATKPFSDDAVRIELSSVFVEMMLNLVRIVRNINAACVIHNDLKPMNIMLAERDRDNVEVVVVDLGMSCYKAGCGSEEDQKRFSDMQCISQEATPGFTPPEVRNNTAGMYYGFDPLDAYAVGRIMLFLATGEFAYTEAHQQLFEHPDAQARIQSGNAQLDHIIAWMLKPNPNDRISLDTAEEQLTRIPLPLPAPLRITQH